METKTPFTLVDIGGRRLAVSVKGEGMPVVVLEMGLGGTGSMYDTVARHLAHFTRVVWYDRAGLGHSDPAPTPRTIQDLVLDLHALLQKMALPGPYVLAGHSMGGPVVRFYHERYPNEVAALVLIDSSHEDQRERYLAVLPPEQSDESPDLAHFRHILRVRWEDPRMNEEKINNLANSELLRTCRSLGDLPLVVLSRGRPDRDPANYPPGMIEEIEQTWLQMQRELAKLSCRSQHIIAAKSGHLINEDEPEVIIEVIRQVVMQVREQRKH